MASYFFRSLLCACCYPLALFAQPYTPLLEDNRHWVYTAMASETPAVHITHAFALSANGDTLIQGKVYKKIHQKTLRLNFSSTAIAIPMQVLGTRLFALMREDRLARKVYLLPSLTDYAFCQPTEHLLYDFSLREGDTVNTCIRNQIYEPFLAQASLIDSIRLETHFGQQRKTWYTQGVFVNEGLLLNSSGRLLEGFGYADHGLINFGRQGPLIRFVSFCEGSYAACGFTSAATELGKPNPIFVLSPNPARDFVRLQANPEHPQHQLLPLQLVDATGLPVLSANWDTATPLDLNLKGVPAGIYRVRVAGGPVYWAKTLVLTPY